MSSNKEGDENMGISDIGSSRPAAALRAEDRANALKMKLQDSAGVNSDINTLSSKVKNRVECLRELQRQHHELEAKLFEGIAAVEAKYQKLYEPLYTKRYEIVNGVVEVEEGEKGTEVSEKGVPNFWLLAMKTNEILSREISKRDKEALKYVKDIRCCKIDKPRGFNFKLEFIFDSNPFFKNSVLTKIYHMSDGEKPMVKKAMGTDIEWYPGKCLTQEILKKKPYNSNYNYKGTEECESFFNFFKPPQVADSENEDGSFDEDPEEYYDIGSAIRDDIIPYAVTWFTGEASEEGYDEDEEDTEEEEEDEVEKDSGKKSVKRHRWWEHPEQDEDECPPKCKQQ